MSVCGGGGMVVEADHGEDLWCGFVHSLPGQENREAQKLVTIVVNACPSWCVRQLNTMF